MPSARILLLDIETAPMAAFTWGPMWETSLIEIIEEGFILSIAYKWLGEKKVITRALPDYPKFAKNHKCDKALCRDAHALLDQADVVVAHNGKSFDVKWLNARFLRHGFRPPSPYKVFDTLTEHRKLIKTASHKLDDLGGIYGFGRKLPTTGKKLWLDCRNGKRSAYKKMRAYNAVDVERLESLYLLLRPWSTSHPNLSHLNRKELNCPVCESGNTKRNGWAYSRCSKKQRFTCLRCGHRYTYGKLEPA